MSESPASSKYQFMIFAAIRKESAFFLPFFPQMQGLTITTKHVAYLIIGVLGIAVLAYFEFVSSYWMLLIPFFLFMSFYKKNKVHPEYVIVYIIKYLFARKEKKSKTIQKKKKDSTRAIFGAATYGRREEATKDDRQVVIKKDVKKIPVNDLDVPIPIKLNIGDSNRLTLVDVYMDGYTLTTNNAVESDGTIIISPTPLKSGRREIIVKNAGTDKVVASDEIFFEERN